MRVSLPISFLAHAAILLAGVIVLPLPDSSQIEQQPPIPVDIVAISDTSKRVATEKSAPKKKPADKPAPPKLDQAKKTKPAPKPAKEVKVATKEPAPAPAPKPTPKPAPEAVQPPDPKPLEQLIKQTEAAPKPEVQSKKAAEAKPFPLPRAKPKPPAAFVKREKKKKEPAFNPNEIAALLNKVPDKKAAPVKASDVTGTPLKGKYTSFTGSSDKLSADVADWLRQQVERCWTPPTGVRDAQNLVVKVHFTLGQDGTVLTGPDVLNPASDPMSHAAEASAVRAVLMCAPYQGLPLDKYDAWRDVILNFDPSHMLATN